VYGMLNRQYGGRMGDLRTYIMNLEDERNRANTRYDDLMGRVVGILGEEYKDLRTDSATFMEKLTGVLGEDLAQSRLDQSLLAEKLGDIDGLRAQVRALTEEKAQLERERASQVAERDARIQSVESDKAALSAELARLNQVHKGVTAAVDTLGTSVSHKEIGETWGGELYAYVLEDSKVPDAVIEGVGRFIDFKKYLRMAAERGAEEATRRAALTVRGALNA